MPHINKLFCLLIFLFYSITNAFCQVKQFQVLDKTSKDPIPFVIVRVTDSLSKDKIVTTTSKDGFFLIDSKQLSGSNLKLSLELLGHAKVDQTFNMQERVFYMEVTSNVLDQVNVISKKKVITVESNKIIYDVQNDSLHNRTHLADAIRQMPGVDVSLTGEIKVRDKKILYMLNGNEDILVKDAQSFMAIPTKLIAKIELITDPDPKYKERGYDLIMNIITKGDIVKGSLGSISAGIDSRYAPNGNIFYYYRKNNFSVNLNGTISENKNTITDFTNANSNSDENTSQINSATTTKTLSSEIDFNYVLNNSLLYAYFNYGLADFTQNSISNSSSTLMPGQVLTNTLLNNDQHKYIGGVGIRLNKISTKTNGSINLSYSITPIKDQINNVIATDDSVNNGLSKESWDEFIFQSDFTTKVNTMLSLDYGLQEINRIYTADYNNLFLKNDAIVSNNNEQEEYKQNIHSLFGYLKFTPNKKLRFNIGLRADISELSSSLGNDDLFNNSYFNLLPRVNVAYKIGTDQVLQFNYKIRLVRPSLYYLSSFINSENPILNQAGNPALKPETYNNFDLTYTHYFNKLYISPELYSSFSTNSIQKVAIPDAGNFIYTFANGGRAFINAFYLGLGGALTSHIQVNVNSAIGRNQISLNNISSNNLFYTTSFNGTYDFNEGITGQISGFFNSPTVQPQGSVTGTNMLLVSLSKSLFNDRANFNLALSDPFFTNRVITNKITDNGFDVIDRQLRSARLLSVSFFYHFGKLESKYAVNGSKTSTEDLKKDH